MKEQRVFDLTEPVLELRSSKMRVAQILFSEKMKQEGDTEDVLGLYERAQNRIILRKRRAN